MYTIYLNISRIDLCARACLICSNQPVAIYPVCALTVCVRMHSATTAKRSLVGRRRARPAASRTFWPEGQLIRKKVPAAAAATTIDGGGGGSHATAAATDRMVKFIIIIVLHKSKKSIIVITVVVVYAVIIVILPRYIIIDMGVGIQSLVFQNRLVCVYTLYGELRFRDLN